MKVYEVTLTFAEHHIDMLGPDIRRASSGYLNSGHSLMMERVIVFQHHGNIPEEK